MTIMIVSYVSVACLALALAPAVVSSTSQGIEKQMDRPAIDRFKEIQLVTQSLNELINELEAIKKEASHRLVSVRGTINQDERIRQSKVSKFVLTKARELELESTSFKSEIEQMFGLRRDDAEKKNIAALLSPSDDLIESGEQLIARLDQEASGNSITGVQEESMRLIDRLVQNYLSNLRRTINRITRFIDHRAKPMMDRAESRQQDEAQQHLVYKRQAINTNGANGNIGAAQDAQIVVHDQFVSGVAHVRQSILNRIQLLSKRLHEFTMQWTRMLGRQQSPLIDRIPPRGVELWRDFWDTVGKQVRRINQEFRQLTVDMTRMLTGRLPSNGQPRTVQYAPLEQQLMFASAPAGTYQNHYDQNRDVTDSNNQQDNQASENYENINVIDENDDESTREELNRNPMLRQQIQQEIGVFGSIFDMMRAFIRRLRESATTMIRDVVDPNATANNNNDQVTPGPEIKPQIDTLLQETINSQRNINSQSKPVMLPNDRDRVVG